MKLIYSICAFILIAFFSCTKFEDPHIYTIKQGKHRSKTKFSIVKNNEVWFHFKFTENHRYLSEIPDDVNRLDLNKLYGITSRKIHDNSARIGWREIDNGNFEIAAYWYKDGVRGFAFLYEAKLGEELEFLVTNFGDYRFYCNGEQLIIPAKEFNTTYRTWPYFGGDNTCPHEMNFLITEL